jgi:hypothetical protein
MDDLHSALAAERSRTFLDTARRDRLAALARCCTPSGLAAGAARVRSAGRSAVHWLRQGQLAGYPERCSC